MNNFFYKILYIQLIDFIFENVFYRLKSYYFF